MIFATLAVRHHSLAAGEPLSAVYAFLLIATVLAFLLIVCSGVPAAVIGELYRNANWLRVALRVRKNPIMDSRWLMAIQHLEGR